MEACDDIDADVYCIFAIDDSAWMIADYCKARGKQYAVFLGSDAHFLNRIREFSMSYLPNGVLSFFAFDLLFDASAVIIPAELPERSVGGGTFAAHPCPIPLISETSDNARPSSTGRHVLWMGETSDHSRPLEFLDLVKAFPEVHFKMLAFSTHERLNQALFDRFPMNLELMGAPVIKEIENLFRDAAVFVNTAPAGGFVHGCYLAAKHGVPILSLESDPEGFIGKGGGGVLLDGDAEQLSPALEDMLGSLERWTAMSKALEDYVSANNSPSAVGERLMGLLGDSAG